MTALDDNTTNHNPDAATENGEPLSQFARRLAERIGTLVERTLDLYEHNLEQAEAEAETEPEPGPTSEENTVPEPAPSRPRPSGPSGTSNAAKVSLNPLAQLKSLVRSMEGLLRVAKHARDLEDRDSKPDELPAFDLKQIKDFLEEIDAQMEPEEEEEEENENTGHDPNKTATENTTSHEPSTQTTNPNQPNTITDPHPPP